MALPHHGTAARPLGEHVAEYRELFFASLVNRSRFWSQAATAVTWTRAPQRVLDDSNPPFYRWFSDGELNTCANALDRQADGGRADQPALIYDSPVTGVQRTYTYRQLLDETRTLRRRFARAGRGQGRPGRRLHAHGARGGDCDARVRAAWCGALGGVRRLRVASGRRSSSRPRAGSNRRGPSSTSPCSTPRWQRPPTRRAHASSCSAICTAAS